jgi:hypothetical protein
MFLILGIADLFRTPGNYGPLDFRYSLLDGENPGVPVQALDSVFLRKTLTTVDLKLFYRHAIHRFRSYDFRHEGFNGEDIYSAIFSATTIKIALQGW